MGQTVELINRQEIVKKEPLLNNSAIEHAIYAPHSFQINPGKVLNDIAEQCCARETNKLEIKSEVHVLTIKKYQQNYLVSLSDNTEVNCSRIFIANGVGVNDLTKLLNIYVPIFPVKGVMLEFDISGMNKLNNMIFSGQSQYNWYKEGLKVPYYSSDSKREDIDH